nr:PREDICTED: uncharacterized protein LOC103282675 [Anolis carolinensis]|eukprot:XP_008123625.1 PREDICTED: uncharacterized protein LOC103282675 [Anolis carolinensis]
MASETFCVCKQLGNELCCFKEVLKHDDIKKNQALNKEEARIAAAAKQGAIEVLQDALKKKKKVLMRLPMKIVVTEEEKYQFWMKRHAILTEDRVKKLLEELKKVRFQKNNYKQNVYAYVKQHDETRTIYLCQLFWDAPEYLQRNSQPGILIHEVSHFLGANDIAYGNDVKPILYVGCKGFMIKSNFRPALSSIASPFEYDVQDALRKAFWNADNVEYEFELTINHKGSYMGGKYSCCGETARYSVCDRSVPESFHTCRVGVWYVIELLVKMLCRRSEKIKGKLREHQRIAEEMEESLRKAKTSGNIGLSMDIVGAAATGASLFLAPGTFGVSLLVGGYVGVAAAGVGLISMRKFKKRAVAQKKELDAIFAECQRFFDYVKILITLLKYEIVLSTDWVFQSYSLLEYIINEINLIIEQIESKKNYVQKIMYMECNIELCAFYLKKLLKIF